MAILERCEWTNMWWDESDKKGQRVLLIGDSITNGYKNLLRIILETPFM